MNNSNHNNNPTGKGGFQEHPENINRNGTPGRQGLKLLREAMAKRETIEGKTLYEHFVKLAFTDKQILIEAMKKLVPNAQHIEIDGQMTLKDFMSVIKGEEPTDNEGDEIPPNDEQKPPETV